MVLLAPPAALDIRAIFITLKGSVASACRAAAKGCVRYSSAEQSLQHTIEQAAADLVQVFCFLHVGHEQGSCRSHLPDSLGSAILGSPNDDDAGTWNGPCTADLTLPSASGTFPAT